MFKFQSSLDVSRILGEPWCLDSTPLLLKRWTPFFDANHEQDRRTTNLGVAARTVHQNVGAGNVLRKLEIPLVPS
jgi:hypothetical protein